MSDTSDLPTFARDILAAVPERGGGLNQWLMRAAIALRAAGRTEQEIVTTLRIQTAGEAIKPGEIERAAKRSADYMGTDNGVARAPATKWPDVDEVARAAVVAKYAADPADLWEASPVRFDDDDSHAEEIVDMLFPGNPLICIADGLDSAETASRDSFRGRLADSQFIVPSPMSKLTGMNQEGRESARCLDNTGPRRYLIVEQDGGTPDEQTAVIMHLAERAPLVLVVRSGGKSLHSWFACGQQPEEVVRAFFLGAVRLGADRATWTRCQLVRMPDGTRKRDDGKTVRQSVIYWNPKRAGAAK